MKKVAIVLVLVAAVAAALYFVLVSGGARPVVAEALSAKQTAAVSGGQQLDALARRWMPLAEMLDADMTPAKVTEEMGFDPTTAEGWRGIGVDPAAGIGVAVDARIRVGDQPVPVALLKVTDADKVLAWFAARTGKAAKIEGDGPVRTLSVGDDTALIGRRGDWTAVLLTGADGMEASRAGFTAFVTGDDPALRGAPQFGDAFAGAEKPLMFGWAGAATTGAMLTSFGAPEAMTSTVDFYAAMFPASAIWAGDEGAGARLLATEKGIALVRKLFVPQRRAPSAARFVGAEGWGAVRFSSNLDQVLDGVGEGMPPAAAQAKAAVGMVRMMLPMVAGVNWDDISAGLSGHMVLAAEVLSLSRMTGDGLPDGIMLLGVQDEAKADALITKLIDRAKAKVPGVAVSEVEFAGEKGRTISAGPMQVSVVRMDDVIVVGSPTAVAAAVKRADGDHLEGDLAKALDGGAMWSAVVDLGPALLDLEKMTGGEPDSKRAFASPVYTDFKASPRLSLTVDLDGQGLLWQGQGPVPADILAVVVGAWGFVRGATISGPIEVVPAEPTPAEPTPDEPTPAEPPPSVAPPAPPQ